MRFHYPGTYSEMCSQVEETHIPSHMCSRVRETHIPSDMCSRVGETHIPADMCSQVGKKHIPADMCSQIGETHIPSDMYSLVGDTHIPSEKTVANVESGIKDGFEEMEHERNFRLKHYDCFNRTTFSEVPLLLKLGSLSEDVFEPRTSTGSVVCYTAVFSVVVQRSSQALRDDTKNGRVADYRK